MTRLLIKNGLLLTQNKNNDVIAGNIGIQNGVINSIGDSHFDSEHVIDAKGKYITPGFIQTHLHLSLPLFQKSDKIISSADIPGIYSDLSLVSIQFIVEQHLQLLISGGTTTILGMEHPLFVGEILDFIAKSGIRAFIGNALMDHGEHFTPLQKSTEEWSRDIKSSLRKIQNDGNDRIHFALSPWSIPLCSGSLWGEISVIANDYHLCVQSHACETKTEIRSVKYGRSVDTLNYLDRFDLANSQLVLSHCVQLSDEDIQIIQQGNVNVVYCPSSNQFFDTGLAPIPQLLDKGVNLSLGSDGVYCNPMLDVFTEMRNVLSNYPNQNISPQRVFDMVTKNGAKTLGLQDQLGSIEIGKKADLLVIDLPKDYDNPVENLVQNGNPDCIQTVLANGNVLFSY